MSQIFIRTLIGVFCLIGLHTNAVTAQGLFDPVATVDSQAVSRYEVIQRRQLNAFIRQPGNTNAAALNNLIEDRLKVSAARQAGLSLSEEGIIAEMENFAQRANMSLAQFTRLLNGKGIDQATLRDFVYSGVIWRELVRSKYSNRGNPSEAEVDRAMAATGTRGGLRVLISEIVLPARPKFNELGAARARAQRITQLTSISAFAAQARAHSASASAKNGGRLPWSNLNQLPAGLRPIIAGLRPGQVSSAIEVPNAIILFQLRQVEETDVQAPNVVAVEYATMNVASDQVLASRKQLDVCDDFYGLAKRTQNATLDRQTLGPDAVPAGIANQIAMLDANELTTRPGPAPGTTQLVMLCGRSLEITQEVTREQVTNNLRQRRLSSLADGYLAELRAAARIVRK